jgi:hypothetical protein
MGRKSYAPRVTALEEQVEILQGQVFLLARELHRVAARSGLVLPGDILEIITVHPEPEEKRVFSRIQHGPGLPKK